MTITITIGECFVCCSVDVELTTLRCGHEMCHHCVLNWFKLCVESGREPQCPFRCTQVIDFDVIFDILGNTTDPSLFALLPEPQPPQPPQLPELAMPIEDGPVIFTLVLR